jgi:putative tricarboxylic transport membrane protein
MDILQNLWGGLQIALLPTNLLYCFIGVSIGNLIGVLPGVGPSATIALLIPLTLHESPVTAIIMLAGIYYGAMYGGTITSVLVNIPGEASSVVTCFDGHQMARNGKAGPALGIAAFGSFIAGTASLIGLMCLASPLSGIALKFGPAEYFGIMCLGLTILSFLTRGSMFKALMMAVLGLFLSYVGMDIFTGQMRFTLGLMELSGGIGLVPMLMGLFGVSEVLLNIESPEDHRDLVKTKMGSLLPSKEDWKNSAKPICRGSLIGFILGIIPGAGVILSPFVSYGVEKKLSRHPEKFGTGAIEGVAGPESANNAAAGGSFIPMFILGVPPNVTIAVLLGAMMIHGMQVGPMLLTEHPELFWGTVASMYIGNVMLLILNVPMIGLWVKILKVPGKILFPLILLFSLIGSYSMNNNLFDVYVMLIFGVFGYLARKYGFEVGPLVLAFVLGDIMEQALRQSLIGSDGSFLVFFQRPISCGALILAALLLLSNFLPSWRKRKSALMTKDI